MTGAEWAATIRAIKADPALRNLRCGNLDDYHEKGSKAACFLSSDGSEAYVVFKGTGENEWPDNFAGLNQASTPQQQAAASYVNYVHSRYPKASIVTSGHSKGGNKAQYAAIMCPFVVGCVAFDAQGFGLGFMETYADRIRERKHLITAYNQSGDFARPLMFSIAGTTCYLDGLNSTGDFAKNHALITLFVRDSEGNLVLASTDGAQSDLSREIGEFTHYLLNTASWSDLNRLSSFLQRLAPLFLSGSEEDAAAAWDMLFDPDNAETLGVLVAYLSEYGDMNGLFDALTGLIPRELVILMTVLAGSFSVSRIFAALVAAGISAAFIALLLTHGDWLSKVIEVASMKRGQIAYRGSSRGGYRGQGSRGKVRDFSDGKKAELLNLVRQIDDEPWFDPRTWDVRYRAESFFGRLKPEYYQDAMNQYYRKVMDINGTSARQIERIFSDARRRDGEFAKEIASTTAAVDRALDTVRNSLML